VTAWHPSHYRRWYAVARSDSVGAAPLAITVLDRHVALARLTSGALIALEDRCPHRHAPLSAGCRTATGLACPYHGWSFGADGRLLAIPGLPPEATLPAVRVRAFATVEHDGLVWLKPGEGGDDAPSDLVRALAPASRRFLWATRWRGHVVDAMENFLDALHTHGIHPGLVRKGDQRRRVTAAVEGTGVGFRIDYRGAAQHSGLLYRRFESPRTSERAGFAAPGSARIEYRYANGSAVTITLHFTPCAPDATQVFASLHVDGRWAPAWAVRLFVWPFLRRVGEQDRRILHRQVDNLARYPGVSGASTAIDLARPMLERFWSDGSLPAIGPLGEVDLLL